MKHDPKLPWPDHLERLDPDPALVEKIEKILDHYTEGSDCFPFGAIAPVIARAVQFEWLPTVDQSNAAKQESQKP